MSIYDNAVTLAILLIEKFANPYSTITHQRYTLSPDSAGGNTKAWTTIASGLQAAVLPFEGNEVYDQARLNAEASHKVYMKYADALNIQSSDRLLFDGRVFDVIDPRNIAEANAVMMVEVKEGVGD